jgi:sugar transferase (PEP-CTERM system associated)
VRIFRYYVAMPIAALAIVETLVILFAPYLAAVVRFGASVKTVETQILEHPVWPDAIAMAVAMLICMVATGLYSTRQRATHMGILVRIAASAGAAGVLMIVFNYVVRDFDLGGGLTVVTVVLVFFLVTLVRVVFSFLIDEDVFKRRILVYGCGRQASSITQLRRRADQRGFLLVGYLAAPGDRTFVPPERIVTAEGSLLHFARLHRIDEIVVAMDDRRRAFPVQDLLECRLSGIDVVDIVSFLERETGRVQLDVLNPSWMIFADGFRRDPVRLFSERAFDLVASLGLLLLTWPVMLLAALAIKLQDGITAPALYRQARVGLEGRVFEVLKFRSMRTDAEVDGPRWADKNDARITRVGALLRKLRIDELPQIINVLKGDMSFVGPRPERPEFVAALNEKIPYSRERHCVKPGITGWAQLCYPYGSSEHDALEKLQYDLYYVKNHSLIFDIVILLQTAEVILWRKGSR